MKKVFVDTNFIIDLIARPDFSEHASLVLKRGRTRNIKFYVCFLSLVNYACIDRKQDRNLLLANLTMLSEIFDVLPNDKQDIKNAINLNSKDFEDSIQYSVALKSKCDCIISRNKKDFIGFSKIPIFTPVEFLEQLKRD